MILRARSMAGHWTLTPRISVRIAGPPPDENHLILNTHIAQ